jgi:hypothetical protein
MIVLFHHQFYRASATEFHPAARECAPQVAATVRDNETQPQRIFGIFVVIQL